MPFRALSGCQAWKAKAQRKCENGDSRGLCFFPNPPLYQNKAGCAILGAVELGRAQVAGDSGRRADSRRPSAAQLTAAPIFRQKSGSGGSFCG